MTYTVTLTLPNEVAERAESVARQTNRRVEDVLLDWLGQAADDAPVATLSDAEVLALCDLQMSKREQKQMSDLLARQREGTLDDTARAQLDAVLGAYRRAMPRKAQALNVAVERHLRPPLDAAN